MAAITTDETAKEEDGYLGSISGFLSRKWGDITGKIWDGVGNALGPTLDSVGNYIDTKIKGLLDFIFGFVKSNFIGMFGTGDFRNFMDEICDNMHAGLVNAFVGAADAQRIDEENAAPKSAVVAPAEPAYGPR